MDDIFTSPGGSPRLAKQNVLSVNNIILRCSSSILHCSWGRRFRIESRGARKHFVFFQIILNRGNSKSRGFNFQHC